MTKKQVQRALERYVAPTFPELRVHGDLLISRDGPILWGFAFERSQMDKRSFRVRAFAQLLTVPASTITYGVSRELGEFRVSDDEEAVFAAAAREAQDRGRIFLGLVNDCRGLINNVHSVLPATTDERLADEIRGHCLVLAGEHQAAMRQLDGLAKALSPPDVLYEEETLLRVKSLQRALSTSPEDAVALLQAWAAKTAERLETEGRAK